MIRDGDRRRHTVGEPPLHDDVAAAPPHLHEAVPPLAHTSWPERTRSLPNGHLDLSNVDLPAESSRDFLPRSGLEEELQRLSQMITGELDRVALTRDIQLGAEGDVSVPFPLDDGCELSLHR